MSAETLLDWVAALGITLTLDGDRIRYAPKSRTPPDLLAELRQHKA